MLSLPDDVRTSLRKALQFGRVELVTVESSLAASGALAEPTDVVVAAKSKVPQLAIEVQWHPRGEDHSGFANAAMADVVKMAVARTKGVVEQAGVLVAAPGRFWRWLPGYSEDRVGYELLGPEEGTPATLKSDFLANSTWDYMFQSGMDHEVPDRLWSSVLGSANLRSPWADMELRLLEVKGLGSARAVR